MREFISYQLTSFELATMNTAQQQILDNFTQYLDKMNFQSLYEIFYASSIMILNGYFSENKHFKRDENYSYVHIANMQDLYYCMTGVGCCRHVNELFRAILFHKDYQVYKLVSCLNSDAKVNHLVIGVVLPEAFLLFDAFNELIFQALKNGNILHQTEDILLLGSNDYYQKIIQKLYLEIKKEEIVNLKQIEKIGDNVYERILDDREKCDHFYEISNPYMTRVRKIISKYEFLNKIGARAYE